VRRCSKLGGEIYVSEQSLQCCEKDGGRPAEVGCQRQASNHFKRLLLRVMVVSIEVKLELKFG